MNALRPALHLASLLTTAALIGRAVALTGAALRLHFGS